MMVLPVQLERIVTAAAGLLACVATARYPKRSWRGGGHAPAMKRSSRA